MYGGCIYVKEREVRSSSKSSMMYHRCYEQGTKDLENMDNMVLMVLDIADN